MMTMTMTTQKNNPLLGRIKDAPWITEDVLRISVLGLGGIGSNTLYNLAKSIPANYYIFDFDRVEEHNIATQFFRYEDLGEHKVGALSKYFYGLTALSKIFPFVARVEDYRNATQFINPITITGFDNMKARKLAFESWKTVSNRELFIDGRLRATSYEVYCVTPDREEDYEATLFDDADIPDDPCTFKQTTFFGMLIGARITNMVTNYLTNKHLGEEVCVVPFKFKELGELCHVEILE